MAIIRARTSGIGQAANIVSKLVSAASRASKAKKKDKTPVSQQGKTETLKAAEKSKKQTDSGAVEDAELSGRINVKFKKGMTQIERKAFQSSEHKRVIAKRKAHAKKISKAKAQAKVISKPKASKSKSISRRNNY